MIVANETVVTLDVELWDLWGTLLQRSETPVHYLHGGYDGIFAAVEAALDGKSTGDKVEVRLEPGDAFGEYDEQLVRVEPRARFPAEVAVGMQFEGVPGDDEDGDEAAAIYTVTDIGQEAVVLDGNHPFAGIALKFQCTVVGVRAATADELERGAADDPDEDGLRVLH